MTLRPKVQITNTDDEVQVLAALKSEQDTEEDLYSILKSARGRRWIAHLVFEKCHLMLLSHTIADTGRSTEFNEGARSVGLDIWREIEARHPEFLPQLVEEYYG
jgi:hypothetical protein